MESKRIPKASGLPRNPLKLYRAFIDDPLTFLQSNTLNDEGISCFNIFHHRIVHLSHPGHIKQVMQDGDSFTQSRDRDHMRLMFGNGLLTSAGKHWKKQRLLLQPCFGKSQSEKLFDKIIAQILSRPLPTEGPFELHRFSLDLVNRIIADILFSRTDDGTLSIGSRLVTLKADTLARLRDYALPLWVPTSRNLSYGADRSAVNKAIGDLVSARKASREEHNDLLSAFIGARDKTTATGMADSEVREELLGVYAAAHEPVAIALTYALLLVSKDDDVRERLTSELNRFVINGRFTATDLRGMRYLKQIVDETLRMYPPVWISGKRAVRSVDVSGFAIKANDNIVYSPMIVQRDEKLWPDPETFDPERFSDKSDFSPSAYFPFGGGAKHCIGAHLATTILTTAVACLFARFALHPLQNDIQLKPFTTLRPINELTFTARHAHTPSTFE